MSVRDHEEPAPELTNRTRSPPDPACARIERARGVSARQKFCSSVLIRQSVRATAPCWLNELCALTITAWSSALDVWSAGIMLLCFLTRRFPFFNSNDDTEALAEIATIFGKKRMERCSALHSE